VSGRLAVMHSKYRMTYHGEGGHEISGGHCLLFQVSFLVQDEELEILSLSFPHSAHLTYQIH
jgi:hypothetical protein